MMVDDYLIYLYYSLVYFVAKIVTKTVTVPLGIRDLLVG